MVNIRSVRQDVPAPKESILGGGLQGFSNFASNIQRKAQEDKESRDQLGLAMLTAYAQQDRTITPSADGSISYAGQGYDIGDKQMSTLDTKRGMAAGIIPKDEGFLAQEKETRYQEMLDTDEYKRAVNKGQWKKVKRMQENARMSVEGKFPVEAKKDGWLSQYFGRKGSPSSGQADMQQKIEMMKTGKRAPSHKKLPDGSYSFDDEGSLQQAVDDGLVSEGDAITVNGVEGHYELVQDGRT